MAGPDIAPLGSPVCSIECLFLALRLRSSHHTACWSGWRAAQMLLTGIPHLMSVARQSRHFGRAPASSGLPPIADSRMVGRHVSKVPMPEVAIQSLASERLESTSSGSSTRERAIRSHDLEQTFASLVSAPANKRSREPALVTHSEGVAPTTLQPDPALAGWWASPYLSRKGASPREMHWMRNLQRGCSPPKLADTGWSGLGVWRATRNRGAPTSMPGSSADAEWGLVPKS